MSVKFINYSFYKKLSVRAANVLLQDYANSNGCLHGEGPLTTRPMVRNALVTGRLEKRRNCGKKTLNEIAVWAGVNPSDVPALRYAEVFICPHCAYAIPEAMRKPARIIE